MLRNTYLLPLHAWLLLLTKTRPLSEPFLRLLLWQSLLQAGIAALQPCSGSNANPRAWSRGLGIPLGGSWKTAPASYATIGHTATTPPFGTPPATPPRGRPPTIPLWALPPGRTPPTTPEPKRTGWFVTGGAAT